MSSIITCVVISITAFSTTKRPMKNRKKTEPNRGNTKYPWTPKFFMEITGSTRCDAQDCETRDIVPTMVRDFYSLFGKEYKQVLRLKVCAILRFHHLHLDLQYLFL